MHGDAERIKDTASNNWHPTVCFRTFGGSEVRDIDSQDSRILLQPWSFPQPCSYVVSGVTNARANVSAGNIDHRDTCNEGANLDQPHGFGTLIRPV